MRIKKEHFSSEVNWHSGKPPAPEEGDAYIDKDGRTFMFVKGSWAEIVTSRGVRIEAELTPTIEWPDPEKFIDEQIQRQSHDPEFLQELKAL